MIDKQMRKGKRERRTWTNEKEEIIIIHSSFSPFQDRITSDITQNTDHCTSNPSQSLFNKLNENGETTCITPRLSGFFIFQLSLLGVIRVHLTSRLLVAIRSFSHRSFYPSQSFTNLTSSTHPEYRWFSFLHRAAATSTTSATSAFISGDSLLIEVINQFLIDLAEFQFIQFEFSSTFAFVSISNGDSSFDLHVVDSLSLCFEERCTKTLFGSVVECQWAFIEFIRFSDTTMQTLSMSELYQSTVEHVKWCIDNETSTYLSYLPEDLRENIASEGPSSLACRWTTFSLPLVVLRQSLYAFRWIATAFTHAHRGKTFRLFEMWKTIHEIRSLIQTCENTRDLLVKLNFTSDQFEYIDIAFATDGITGYNHWKSFQ